MGLSRFRRDAVHRGAMARLLVGTILKVPPSALRKAGIPRAVAIVTQAAEKLRLPDTPEVVRAEHLPVIEAELARLQKADRDEDVVRASFAALRAAVVIFKGQLERERGAQFADLVKAAGSRQAADEFFLSAYTRGDAVEDAVESEDAGKDA